MCTLDPTFIPPQTVFEQCTSMIKLTSRFKIVSHFHSILRIKQNKNYELSVITYVIFASYYRSCPIKEVILLLKSHAKRLA